MKALAGGNMGKARSGCGLILVIVVGIIVGAALAVTIRFRLDRSRSAEQQEAVMNGGPPIRPVWLRQPRACKPLTPLEQQRDEAMAQVARTSITGQSARGLSNPVLEYAISYFSWHWSHLRFERCAPDQAYVAALLPALDATNWPAANAQGKELRLVERVEPSARLANALAHVAFLSTVPPRDVELYDTRPYARMLLGDQGEFAKPWAAEARAEINGDSKLGTAAAYIAVGTDARTALPLVEKAMAEKLRTSLGRQVKTWKDTADATSIRSDDADRLIELAYALGKAGNSADKYSGPLLMTLDHSFARAAPPFGLLAANPTELCRVAAWIGGRTARIARTKPACVSHEGGDGRPTDYP